MPLEPMRQKKKKVKNGRDGILSKVLEGYGRAMAQALYSQDGSMRPKKKVKDRSLERIGCEHGLRRVGEVCMICAGKPKQKKRAKKKKVVYAEIVQLHNSDFVFIAGDVGLSKNFPVGMNEPKYGGVNSKTEATGYIQSLGGFTPVTDKFFYKEI